MSPRRLDRAVLTTGANSGLGLATAIAVAKAGYRSIGTVRTEAKAAVVAQAAEAAGVHIDTVILEITDAAGCEAIIDDVRPYALVNNAGFMEYRAVEETDDERAQRVMDTLVLAPMRLARLAIPHMRKQGGGRIVQVLSLAGRISYPLLGWYQGAKHALEAVSDALRMEVASSGIAVMIVEPGGFKSGITDEGPTPDADTDPRYVTAMDRTQKGLGLMGFLWSDPDKVASVITTAIGTRFPRPRYVVGRDARLSLLTEPYTPTIVRDFALRRLTGL